MRADLLGWPEPMARIPLQLCGAAQGRGKSALVGMLTPTELAGLQIRVFLFFFSQEPADKHFRAHHDLKCNIPGLSQLAQACLSSLFSSPQLPCRSSPGELVILQAYHAVSWP